MRDVTDFALRTVLHEEVHARPPVALWPNERILSQAFLLTGAEQRDAQRAWIIQLTDALGQTVHPVHGQSVRVLELCPAPNRLLLKWEMHGEFCVITLYGQSAQPQASFAESRAELLSRVTERLLGLGCPLMPNGSHDRISAVDVWLQRQDPLLDAAELQPLFQGNTLVGSQVLQARKAQVWTDFQLDPAGFDRLYVAHQGMNSRQAGRVVQRLIDVDTYRMMAMLALPRAKTLAEPLRQAETELTALTAQIAEAASGADRGAPIEADEALLRGVSRMAAKVEGWQSEHATRFTASEAYSDLAMRALTELSESPIPGIQTLTEFMDRRFEPAMRTCRWTQRRLKDLSDRVSRATQSLRTRLEFVNEQQTQVLLASMDRRARLQLKLQQTVEGLSLVVLTYYAASLVGMISKGLKSWGLDLPVDQVVALSVPVIALLLALGIRQSRRRFEHLSSGPDAHPTRPLSQHPLHNQPSQNPSQNSSQ